MDTASISSYIVILLGVMVLVNAGYISHGNEEGDLVKFHQKQKEARGPSVRFIVAVNFTEGPCLATTVTQPLQADTQHNSTAAVHVGSCDSGPLDFRLTYGKNKTIEKLSLTFHSSVIEDASPPTCDIAWNGTYLLPPDGGYTGDRLPSLLPGCFTADSREGYHMTYYWFYIFDWTF